MQARTARLYNWATEKASSEKAHFWLGLIFALEIVLFIPLDAVLMFFCMQKRHRIALYIAIAAIASTLSGLIGYYFGHFLWDFMKEYVMPALISESTFQSTSRHLETYSHWAVFFGSLTPFPIKVLSLVSGAFQLGAATFASAFVLARLVRFAVIGGLVAYFGDKVKTFFDKHFQKIFIAIGAKVALIFLGFWYFAT